MADHEQQVTPQMRPPLDQILTALASANGGDLSAARDRLVSIASDRMRDIAHRMLAGSPRVCRWAETDDVLQGALLRLHRALGVVTPNDPQHFLRLAALQVRRELIDLTRRFGNPESFAANHETNSLADGRQRSDAATEQQADPPDRLAEWSRFHEIVEALPDEERELFSMVWYLGLSQDEIAQLLECSTRTVRRRWDETKRRFTDAFQGRMPE